MLTYNNINKHMEESKELRQCSRCHSKILLKYFQIDRKGEYYKLCNNCRSIAYPLGVNRLDMTNDEYQQYRNEYRHKIDKCSCGSEYFHQNKSQHEKTKKHKTYLASLQ